MSRRFPNFTAATSSGAAFRILRLLVLMVVIIGGAALPAARAVAGELSPAAVPPTFVVNSTADDEDLNPGDAICATAGGVCTLRAAIVEANLHTGPDTIGFNIPGGGVQTIQLLSTPPTLNDLSGGTTIDGYTQPESHPNTDEVVSNAAITVEVRGKGEAQFAGFLLNSPGNVIRGLAIYSLHSAIRIYGANGRNNQIVGNFIGTDASGLYAATVTVGGSSGMELGTGASHNSIGGATPAQRNIISGNGHNGIVTYDPGTDYNTIVNNIIGLAPSGDRRLANRNHGIDINTGSSHNKVGGTAAGERNIVSGNGTSAVEVSHQFSTADNSIIGNYIGTDVTGTQGPKYAANGNYGINIQDYTTNTVVAHNIVGNNKGGGINITDVANEGTQVSYNRVGISLNDAAIPNGSFGIRVTNTASHARIGPDNIVAHNPVGILVTTTAGAYNTITRNRIFSNGTFGIDLAPLGVVNEASNGNSVVGANGNMTIPLIVSALPTQVTGKACPNCTVEIFVSDRKANRYGQSKLFVGSGVAGSDGTFTVNTQTTTLTDYVTATATDTAGNTSEFSLNFEVGLRVYVPIASKPA
jgi:CSLREA domain-containing protein